MRPLMFYSTNTSTYSRFKSLTYSVSSYLLSSTAPAGAMSRDQFLLRGTVLAVCLRPDADAIVVVVIVGSIVTGKVLVHVRVVVHLVDPVAVPVIGGRHLQVSVVGTAGVDGLQPGLHGVLVGGEAVVGGTVLLFQVAVLIVGIADLPGGAAVTEHRLGELAAFIYAMPAGNQAHAQRAFDFT